MCLLREKIGSTLENITASIKLKRKKKMKKLKGMETQALAEVSSLAYHDYFQA